MHSQYNKTITACFVGYIVQAIVNNFVPLLFLVFQRTYGIPLSQITLFPQYFFSCLARRTGRFWQLSGNLKMGILVGIVFPIMLLLGIVLCRKSHKK